MRNSNSDAQPNTRPPSPSRGAYLLVPPTYAAGSPSPLIVVLHGAGQGAAEAAAALAPADWALLASRRALVVLPESQGRTWDAIRT
jgi:poly(3-hydroxybutyrate) depolymerase